MTKLSTLASPNTSPSSDEYLHTPSVVLSDSDRPSPHAPRATPHDDSDDEDTAMSQRTPLHASGVLSQQPLLQEDKAGRSPSGDYGHRRQDSFRTRSPNYTPPEDMAKTRYIYAALCLTVSLISFVIQTETAVYIQHELHWNKAYCMLWLTHGSWSLLWPAQLLFLRISHRKQPWSTFWRRHKQLLRTTAQMVQHQDLHLSASTTATSPWPYMIKTTAFVTTFLTFAGASWYIAVDQTSPSDLTAIYNCSAFFAYVFSIMLLNDKLRTDKIVSVGLAIIGVLVVAYGDKEDSSPKTPGHSGGSTNPSPDSPPNNRLLGNLIIGVGSVLYGLYEVLYKKYACPPEGTSPGRGMIFANTFGSMIGTFTLCVLWIPLPILHFLGWERFVLPTGKTAWLLSISTLSNAVFSGAFLVLMSLTSPVLSSVAALLTIFLVAIVDWFLTGKDLSIAALVGGTLIIVAFLLLSWATYRELKEGDRKRQEEEDKIFDDEDVDADVVVRGHDTYNGEDSEDNDIPSHASDRRRHRQS